MIPGVLFLTIFVFSMVRIVPGDVIEVIVGMQGGGRGGYMSDEMKDKVRAQLGIDKPIYIQYFLMDGADSARRSGRVPVQQDPRRRFSQEAVQRYSRAHHNHHDCGWWSGGWQSGSSRPLTRTPG